MADKEFYNEVPVWKRAFINSQELEMYSYICRIGQNHLLRGLGRYSTKQRLAFIDQFTTLIRNYPGGMDKYQANGRKLLLEVFEEKNPYEGFYPEVPIGERVDFHNEHIHELEGVGKEELKHACFVLVAGGLGERLGYHGIKVQIPVTLITNECFMAHYISYILAFGTDIPLAIMTSDDTYQQTINLLKANGYFGMKQELVTIMKQEKIPALVNNFAEFAKIKGQLEVETKPHGHGDVHFLLFSTGLIEKWRDQGKKWVIFFQDTNPLVFKSYPAVLGVSKKKNLEVNSISVPVKPGEPLGVLCHLVNVKTKIELTINVEYNMIDSLLKHTIGYIPTDKEGYNLYPGGINSLIFSIPEYVETLQRTQGLICEFINPKYHSLCKMRFKSSTRLECMMQDYPKLLPSGNRVGFTAIDRKFCFSTIKNDLQSAAVKKQQGLIGECAGDCEADVYYCNAEILRICGAQIEHCKKPQQICNMDIAFGPRIILKPSFGITMKDIKNRLRGNLIVKDRSTLILEGDIYLEGEIYVDGVLHLNGKNGEIFKNIKAYDTFLPIKSEEHWGIRGYTIAYAKHGYGVLQKNSQFTIKNVYQSTSTSDFKSLEEPIVQKEEEKDEEISNEGQKKGLTKKFAKYQSLADLTIMEEPHQ